MMPATDFEYLEQTLAHIGRRKMISVYEGGIRLTDFGVQNGRDEKPTVFTFTPDGELLHIDRWVKALWIAALIWWKS
jgi:hypothetical protein